MKNFFLTFLLLLVLQTTFAQVTEIPGKDGMIDNIKTVSPQLLQRTFPKAQFLHYTDKGTVFALPVDNMPCLVPKITGNMPVVGTDMNLFKKIPNAFPEFKIIPVPELPKTNPIPVPGK